MLITEIDVEKYKLAVICKSNMLKLSKPLDAYLIGENSGKKNKVKVFSLMSSQSLSQQNFDAF